MFRGHTIVFPWSFSFSNKEGGQIQFRLSHHGLVQKRLSKFVLRIVTINPSLIKLILKDDEYEQTTISLANVGTMLATYSYHEVVTNALDHRNFSMCCRISISAFTSAPLWPLKT